HSSVDEDRRRGFHAQACADAHLFLYAIAILRGIHTGGKPGRIEARIGRVLLEELHIQRLLIGEQAVVVLPELALLARTLSGLRRPERLRMDRRQRKVLPDDADAVAVGFLDTL